MPLEAYWIKSYATNLLLMQGRFSAAIAVAEMEVESKEDGGPDGASLNEKKSQDKAHERRSLWRSLRHPIARTQGKEDITTATSRQ